MTALRTGLFHSPETVGLLRAEAVDRFLRWREVERAVKEIKSTGKRKRDQESPGWTKAQWEMEWMENLSLHVARRMREGTITQRDVAKAQSRSNYELLSTDSPSEGHGDSPSTHDPDEEMDERNDRDSSFQPSSSISFDPLHLPSLFFFSLSLFDPLRSRVKQSARGLWGDWNWKLPTLQMAIVGGVGFCFGLGLGLFAQLSTFHYYTYS